MPNSDGPPRVHELQKHVNFHAALMEVAVWASSVLQEHKEAFCDAHVNEPERVLHGVCALSRLHKCSLCCRTDKLKAVTGLPDATEYD